jgi:16S rRNA (adenine1518-N6/adenine1519-N6)-dimethyltransferase
VTERPPFQHYLARMAERGFRPSRRLGQNFLLQPELHRTLVDAIDLGPADTALEVGPGVGFLTRELAERAGEVVAVEIDDRLADILAEDLAALPGGDARVRLLVGDVLAGGGELAPPAVAACAEAMQRLGGRLFLTSNLPYAVAGPVFAAVACGELPFAGFAAMVQEEFGRRILARRATPDYGGLSVLTQAAFAPRLVRRVGREVFRPRPRVSSVIVAGPARDSWWRLPTHRRRDFGRFVRSLFTSRRKKLKNAVALAQAVSQPTPTELVAILHQRPEEVELDDLFRLWEWAGAGQRGR